MVPCILAQQDETRSAAEVTGESFGDLWAIGGRGGHPRNLTLTLTGAQGRVGSEYRHCDARL